MKKKEIHAVFRMSVQVGPEDWEMVSLVIDVDRFDTFESIIQEFKRRSGMKDIRHFEVEIHETES